MKAVFIGMICTFFEALNVPVFWPILVMYFIILFTITMKRQIKVILIDISLLHYYENFISIIGLILEILS